MTSARNTALNFGAHFAIKCKILEFASAWCWENGHQKNVLSRDVVNLYNLETVIDEGNVTNGKFELPNQNDSDNSIVAPAPKILHAGPQTRITT